MYAPLSGPIFQRSAPRASRATPQRSGAPPSERGARRGSAATATRAETKSERSRQPQETRSPRSRPSPLAARDPPPRAQRPPARPIPGRRHRKTQRCGSALPPSFRRVRRGISARTLREVFASLLLIVAARTRRQMPRTPRINAARARVLSFTLVLVLVTVLVVVKVRVRVSVKVRVRVLPSSGMVRRLNILRPPTRCLRCLGSPEDFGDETLALKNLPKPRPFFGFQPASKSFFGVPSQDAALGRLQCGLRADRTDSPTATAARQIPNL